MAIDWTVSTRGPAGAIDMSSVELVTGEPGSDVSYDDGVLSIPRGNTGGKGDKGDPGQNVTITTVTTQAAFDASTPGPTELVVLV